MRSTLKPVLVVLIAFAAVTSLSMLLRPGEMSGWSTDFKAATAEASRTGKPMLVDFDASWCGWCQEMRRTTWSDPQVRKALEGYVPVRIDVDQNPELASRYHVSGIPCVAVINASGDTIKRNDGYLPPEPFLAWLRG